MKIINHKDAINCRLYKGMIIVETAIYRVSCLNQTVLEYLQSFDTRSYSQGGSCYRLRETPKREGRS
ncbi:MAG: hypothetical protein V7K26_04325 [Nostoc sp.]|uniref:hypothetical protein n=1 Tax=Nostoc sp. TaxID=1180 RepID=UPI002FF2D4B2